MAEDSPSSPTTSQLNAAANSRRAYPAGATITDWLAPDGWRHRRFDWPGDGRRGRLLIQGGRADIVEKYLETIAHFHAAGWDVTSFDWRGQGGSGRLSANPRVGHAADFGAFVADLGAFWHQWKTGDGPHVLLTHSMGGHIALRALLDRAIDPDAVVLVAPMVGIHSPLGQGAGTALARLLARIAGPARPAWKVDPRTAGHRQQLLTHDLDRFADEAFWYADQPDLLLGPPSWPWIAQAFVSGARLRGDPRLADLNIPIQLLVADHDGLVDPAAALALAAKLPDVEIVRFGVESAHEILREGDAVRTRAYAAIDAFLDSRVRSA